MKLGVDFGTTRIVVAAADRGNYPLVTMDAPDGQAREWFPPLVALSQADARFGWDAWAVRDEPGWTVVRSLKRLLKDAGPTTRVEAGGQGVPLQELVAGLLRTLDRWLRTASTLRPPPGDPLEVMIGVPANANSNQRFLTAEAFRAAGFQVLGMLNEPSAASIEFGHRDRAARRGQPGHSLLVYDLGGGTFDASLVEMEEAVHTVAGSAGISELGGDDFDEILAGLALETAGVSADDREALSEAQWFRLAEECRERKETLNPNTRKLAIDLDGVHEGWGTVTVAAADFYERCRPLIERTETVVEDLIARHPSQSIETLYVTGGGSELPAVARVLKETFGRRVRRSAYMRSATAIGLAIAADERSGYRLRDRFSANFGVWREADSGHNVAFDLLFPRGLELPRPGAAPVRTVRAYRPAHNIGHFRYVECSHIDPAGQPAGDLTVWDDIRFSFDPLLRDHADLSGIPVSRGGGGSEVEEEYTCDAGGMVKVTITDHSAGYHREYALGRWSARQAPAAVPHRPRSKRAR